MEIDKSNEIKEAMANIYTQIAEREDKSTQISIITKNLLLIQRDL